MIRKRGSPHTYPSAAFFKTEFMVIERSSGKNLKQPIAVHAPESVGFSLSLESEMGMFASHGSTQRFRRTRQKLYLMLTDYVRLYQKLAAELPAQAAPCSSASSSRLT